MRSSNGSGSTAKRSRAPATPPRRQPVATSTAPTSRHQGGWRSGSRARGRARPRTRPPPRRGVGDRHLAGRLERSGQHLALLGGVADGVDARVDLQPAQQRGRAAVAQHQRAAGGQARRPAAPTRQPLRPGGPAGQRVDDPHRRRQHQPPHRPDRPLVARLQPPRSPVGGPTAPPLHIHQRAPPGRLGAGGQPGGQDPGRQPAAQLRYSSAAADRSRSATAPSGHRRWRWASRCSRLASAVAAQAQGQVAERVVGVAVAAVLGDQHVGPEGGGQRLDHRVEGGQEAVVAGPRLQGQVDAAPPRAGGPARGPRRTRGTGTGRSRAG